jgi:hypothetical protein
MAILKPDRDGLRGDPLQGDQLSTFDPLSPENDQIATYKKDWGFAVTPEQEAGANQYKGDIDKRLAQQKSALASAQSQFAAQMSAADKEAQGLLSRARSEAAGIKGGSMDLVSVRVVDGSGKNVEGSYTVPREVADKLAATKGLSTSWISGNTFNISSRVDGGRTQGQELHDALREGQAMTQKNQSLVNKQVDAAKKAAGMQVGALEKQIESEKGIAQANFAQQESMAQQSIAATERIWPNFLGEMTDKFIKGRETNTGGIRDLLASGALVAKGGLK